MASQRKAAAACEKPHPVRMQKVDEKSAFDIETLTPRQRI